MTSCMRSIMAESWDRCREYGLAPQEGYFRRASSDTVASAIEKRGQLARVTVPFMKTIYYAVNRLSFAVVLTDEEGIVVATVAESRLEPTLRNIDFEVGVSCAEQDVGTNGIGTAIAVNQPVEIYGDDHYCQCHRAWATVGVPIHDLDGRIIGCIGCCGPKDVFHPHTLGMLIASSKAIENQIGLEEAMMELSLYSKLLKSTITSVSDGLISFDTEGNIQEINNVAKDLLELGSNTKVNAKHILGASSFAAMIDSAEDYQDKEITVKTPSGPVQCYFTGKPIVSDDTGNVMGIVAVLRDASRVHRLANRIAGGRAWYTFDDLVGKEEVFVEMLNVAMMAAKGPSNVLLQGESGTGKELVAQAIHNASNRRGGPFIAVNCSAIPRDLLASELFGFEEGTFTGAAKGGRPGKFELANGGTLLLDEIGDMPYNMQSSLLRVIQEKSVTRLGSAKPTPVDVRIIACTNSNLRSEVAKGHFRQDLFFRLNVVDIRLPPLRERPGDIPLLVNEFIAKKNRELGKNVKAVDDEVMSMLMAYEWPGNVRELENLIERCINVCGGTFIDKESLPANFATGSSGVSSEKAVMSTLEASEKKTVVDALEITGGNVTRASSLLGIDRSTLYRKISRYDISIDEIRNVAKSDM